MTELIVALDNPSYASGLEYLAWDLKYLAGIEWIKIGPQNILNFPHTLLGHFKIFLDAKLADTKDTVKETAHRWADMGITSISTFTEEATEAAIIGAGTSNLRVWQIYKLTDIQSYTNTGSGSIHEKAHAIISPGWYAKQLKIIYPYKPLVSPAIRMGDDADQNGHLAFVDAQDCKGLGIDYAVVGRPIWQSKFPAKAALKFKKALA